MPPFGYKTREPNCSLKRAIYLRLFGQPFSWSKPKRVLNAVHPSHGDVILDVGCRSGAMAAEFAVRGARVIGIDTDRSAIGSEVSPTCDFACRMGWVVCDARACALASGAFTKATILDCLEHIERDGDAVAELHRVLAPGGRLIVTVPTIPGHPPHRVFTRLIQWLPASWLRAVKSDKRGEAGVVEFVKEKDQGLVVARSAHEDLLRAFGHYRHYDERSLRQLLEAAGFEIVAMKRYQMLFESEMMHFHHAVKGLQSRFIYPLLRLVSLLDIFLPASYPGVGLLAIARKPKEP
ncbi:MAG: class I SAM-dependent methyltransferase [Candidatus Sumerlaeota bacterium]|nr:class I SAM-dependent methyltransferase [Candidatus Sumerlaeota bacterium]